MNDSSKSTGVVPNITLCGRSREAIEFWKQAFGASEIAAYAEHDGRIRHAEVEVNGGNVFLTDIGVDHRTEFEPTPSIAMHLAVPDGGAWVKRAEGAGCRVITPWQKLPFGGFGRVVDPFGIIWQIATPDDFPA